MAGWVLFALLPNQLASCAKQENSVSEPSHDEDATDDGGGAPSAAAGGRGGTSHAQGGAAVGGGSEGGASGAGSGGAAGAPGGTGGDDGGCDDDLACDDQDDCSVDSCMQGQCLHVQVDDCESGVPFTVNSFNSFEDWSARLTTPDARPIVDTGMSANLEGNANLYVADSNGASLEMGVGSLVGLKSLTITIQSAQAGTAGLVSIGVYDGAWVDLPLADYGEIAQGSYSTIEVPLADFGVSLGAITSMRLAFEASGVEKEWRIDEVAASD